MTTQYFATDNLLWKGGDTIVFELHELEEMKESLRDWGDIEPAEFEYYPLVPAKDLDDCYFTNTLGLGRIEDFRGVLTLRYLTQFPEDFYTFKHLPNGLLLKDFLEWQLSAFSMTPVGNIRGLVEEYKLGARLSDESLEEIALNDASYRVITGVDHDIPFAVVEVTTVEDGCENCRELFQVVAFEPENFLAMVQVLLGSLSEDFDCEV